MENTGLKTKKGEEIYNGDVLVNHGWLNVVFKHHSGKYCVAFAEGIAPLEKQPDDDKFIKLGSCINERAKFKEEYILWVEKNEQTYDDILKEFNIRQVKQHGKQ